MNKDNCVFFGVGFGLGAVAALLMAPKPGAELREELSSRVTDQVNQSVDFVKRQHEAVTNVVANGVKDKVDRVNEALKQGKRIIHNEANNLTAAVQGAKDAYLESVATTPDA